MTASLEELRAALSFASVGETEHGGDVIHLWKRSEGEAILNAAQTLLQLMETHTPEKIEALLKGEAEIRPIEKIRPSVRDAVREMINIDKPQRCIYCGKDWSVSGNEAKCSGPVHMDYAMRQSSEVT